MRWRLPEPHEDEHQPLNGEDAWEVVVVVLALLALLAVVS